MYSKDTREIWEILSGLISEGKIPLYTKQENVSNFVKLIYLFFNFVKC